jgi:hypothetical protein
VLKKNRPLLLIVVCLALGVLVYLDNEASDDDAAKLARSHAPAHAAAGKGGVLKQADGATPGSAEHKLHNPLADFDKARLKDWVARPLFAPSRQRPPAAKTATRQQPLKAATRPPPSYDLLGILRDGTRAIALLRKKGEGTSFRVEVGDMIGGWRVAKMDPASVVLERADGTSQTMQLSRE